MLPTLARLAEIPALEQSRRPDQQQGRVQERVERPTEHRAELDDLPGCGWTLEIEAVETLTGLLFAALFVYWGFVPQLAVTWLLCAALIAVIFIDAEHQIIPNAITFPGIPLGLACAWLLPTPPDIVDALFGLFIAGGMMWAIAAVYEWSTGRVGLGMGDVKLVAMLGCFLGLQAALGILVIGSFLGLGQALVMIAFRGAGRLTRIPFGPALAVAGIVHLFDPNIFPRLLGQL